MTQPDHQIQVWYVIFVEANYSKKHPHVDKHRLLYPCTCGMGSNIYPVGFYRQHIQEIMCFPCFVSKFSQVVLWVSPANDPANDLFIQAWFGRFVGLLVYCCAMKEYIECLAKTC